MSLECPFCGAEDDDCIPDAWEYELNEHLEVKCGSCEQDFIMHGEPEIIWKTSKPQCEEHSYGEADKFDYQEEGFTLWSKHCNVCDNHKITHKLPLYADKPEDF